MTEAETLERMQRLLKPGPEPEFERVSLCDRLFFIHVVKAVWPRSQRLDCEWGSMDLVVWAKPRGKQRVVTAWIEGVDGDPVLPHEMPHECRIQWLRQPQSQLELEAQKLLANMGFRIVDAEEVVRDASRSYSQGTAGASVSQLPGRLG